MPKVLLILKNIEGSSVLEIGSASLRYGRKERVESDEDDSTDSLLAL